MNKFYVIIALLGVFLCSSAQIGINTSNPQILFHIDAKQNNNTTGIPTDLQTDDDVVITEEGYMGIGTIAPQTKLDIRKSTITSNLLFIDNGAGLLPNQYLISDSDGNALWSSVYASWFAYLVSPRDSIVSNNQSGIFPIINYENSGVSEAGLGSCNETLGTITVPYTGIYKLICTAHLEYKRSYAWDDKYKVGFVVQNNALNIWNPTSIGVTIWGIAPVFSTLKHLNAGDVLSMHIDQRFPNNATTTYNVNNAPVSDRYDSPLFIVEYLQ